MESSRRSSRRNKDASPPVSSPAAAPPAAASASEPSSSRKRPRTRQARTESSAQPSAPPPPPPEPESFSASANDEATGFLPREPRYATSRAAFHLRQLAEPDSFRPKTEPVTPRFITAHAAKRYKKLTPRKFVDAQTISLTDEKLSDVRKVVIEAGLIYTLIDCGPYQPTVVREFMANLLDCEERDDGVAVFLRGSMVELSPGLINAMYCIPGFDENPEFLDDNIDEVCGYLTDGKILRWEDMSSKYLTKYNQVLYKLVCSNWIPTTNWSTMTQDRLKLLYMIHHHESFDFGKLVYDQLLVMSGNTEIDKTRRIIFPSLIQAVIDYQCIVPPSEFDVALIGTPRNVVKDAKAGRGAGIQSAPPTLEQDLDRLIADLKAVRLRVRRGEYVQAAQEEEDDDEDSD